MSAESRVNNRLKKVNPPTLIQGVQSAKDDENSYFKVYDLTFSEPTPEEEKQAGDLAIATKGTQKDALDKLTLTISGNESAIALQASLLDAMRDLLRYELKKIGIGGGDNKDIFKRRGHPEVKLVFYQKQAEIEKDYTRLKAEISFDLMDFVDTANKVSATQKLIKDEDVKSLSKKIKSIFTHDLNWLKGKKIVVYHDWARGYNLQIYCDQEAEGIQIVKAICQIQNHTIKNEFLKLSQPLITDNKNPIPKEEVVLGKKVKQKRYRPIGTVYFSHATLTLPTYGTKIILA